MIVAVAVVLVMQMPIYEVVHVVAMRNRLVAAARAVDMVSRMSPAVMSLGAFGRIRVADGDRMFFHHAIFALMVQMPIMQVVDMAVVLDGGMAASGAVYVIVIVVSVCHGVASFFAVWFQNSPA